MTHRKRLGRAANELGWVASASSAAVMTNERSMRSWQRHYVPDTWQHSRRPVCEGECVENSAGEQCQTRQCLMTKVQQTTQQFYYWTARKWSLGLPPIRLMKQKTCLTLMYMYTRTAEIMQRCFNVMWRWSGDNVLLSSDDIMTSCNGDLTSCHNTLTPCHNEIISKCLRVAQTIQGRHFCWCAILCGAVRANWQA